MKAFTKSSTDRGRFVSLIETLFMGIAIFISWYVFFSFFTPKNYEFWYTLYPCSRILYCNYSFSIHTMIKLNTFRYSNLGLCQALCLIVLIFCGRVISSLTLPKWLKSYIRTTSWLNNIIKTRSFSCSIMLESIYSFSTCFDIRYNAFSMSENFGINYWLYFLC